MRFVNIQPLAEENNLFLKFLFFKNSLQYIFLTNFSVPVVQLRRAVDKELFTSRQRAFLLGGLKHHNCLFCNKHACISIVAGKHLEDNF